MSNDTPSALPSSPNSILMRGQINDTFCCGEGTNTISVLRPAKLMFRGVYIDTSGQGLRRAKYDQWCKKTEQVSCMNTLFEGREGQKVP